MQTVSMNKPTKIQVEVYEKRKTPVLFYVDYTNTSFFGSDEFDVHYQKYISQKLKNDYNLKIEFEDKQFIISGTCSQSQIASAFIFIGYAMSSMDEGR